LDTMRESTEKWPRSPNLLFVEDVKSALPNEKVNKVKTDRISMVKKSTRLSIFTLSQKAEKRYNQDQKHPSRAKYPPPPNVPFVEMNTSLLRINIQ